MNWNMLVTIIADASFDHRSGAAGYGYWAISERGKRAGGGSIKSRISTSVAAEMVALVRALEDTLTKTSPGIILAGDRILLQTDCQPAIDALKGSRQNLDKVERAAYNKLEELRLAHRLTILFKHVKGHTNRGEARYVTNRLCDKRAKAGMKEARNYLQPTLL